MKRVIAAVEVAGFSEAQLVQFYSLAEMVEGKLVIIFLEDVVGAILPVTRTLPNGAYTYYEEIDWKRIEERKNLVLEKAEAFYEICRRRNLPVALHEKKGLPLEEIVAESNFADLLLVNAHTTFSTLFDSDPPRFVKDVLREAHCPVLVMPPDAADINEWVFTYNGSSSSLYAIRQFTQLFNHIAGKKVTVVYARERHTGEVPHESLLKEYMDLHYPQWELELLAGEPAKAIKDFLLNKKDSMVTFGAYGRSKLSQFFHKSEAETILQGLSNGVFITHP
jgi:ferritin-like protein